MKIPQSLRKKLAEAGRKGAAAITNEDRSRGGKRSWANRLKRAQEEEALAAQKHKTTNTAPSTKGIL